MTVPISVDPQWYRKIWTLDIHDMSWVEPAAQQVDFVVGVLHLRGQERILDLACGFGRHALELARRGHPVVGVDITPAYVEEARGRAKEGGFDAEFICADLREVSFCGEFDVVLNLADGAIGYLEDDVENLKVFDRIAAALKPGGVHLMEVCNAAYARKHFPRRHWEAGSRALSLADFDWDERTCRMTYVGYTLRYGEVLRPPKGTASSVRLYTLQELHQTLAARGIQIRGAYGDYDAAVPASDDRMALLVYSQKRGKTMERHGMVIRVKPDRLEAYKAYHADVWPEILDMIRACNIRNYSIYHKDGYLYSYFEYLGDDFEADMAKMAADPKTQEWWDIMMPMQEPLETRAEGEWWAEMEEVFHMD